MTGDDRIDIVVIGGGVVGLACARACALSGREVFVLEAEPTLGMHTSSRNSEVIHAGIYYPQGSEKARLCLSGRHALYAYCEREGVPHQRLGKLIVATEEAEVPALEKILNHARANGVDDLTWLDAGEIHELEPELKAVRALLSPSTGIVDSHALMAAFKREAVQHGAQVVPSTPVLAGEVEEGGFALELGGPSPGVVRCRALVNAAGLSAPGVSATIRGLSPAAIPRAHYAKGHYFGLRGRVPFRRLVYPVPEPGGLGVHLTLDLAGQARFGPDVVWVSGIDYSFDEGRAQAFYAAIRRYYPALDGDDLVAGYVGVRPKLGPAGTTHDFVIQGPETTGAEACVALYGIESPGLTASLAIADRVLELLG